MPLGEKCTKQESCGVNSLQERQKGTKIPSVLGKFHQSLELQRLFVVYIHRILTLFMGASHLRRTFLDVYLEVWVS